MEQFKGQPRLPKFAVPKRYDIWLKPDLAACKFAGSVAIDVDVVSKTKFIVLNAAELSVTDAAVSFTPKGSSQKSLAAYIKKHACSNAKTEDLWAALEEGSGEPVNKLMNSWTKQKGYPVVSVSIKDQKLEFEQTQFLSSGSQGDGQWIVPISLCCGSYEACKNFLLQDRSTSINADGAPSWIKVLEPWKVELIEQDEILVLEFRKTLPIGLGVLAIGFEGTLNDGMKGFYRSKYEHNGEKKNMAVTQFEPADARRCFPCWDEPACKISFKVARIAADATPELMDNIKQFFISLFQYSAEKLGWEPKQGESHLDAMLRGEILTALAVFGHEETQKEASRRFNAFLEDRNTPLLPPDTRKAAYVAVMQAVNSSNRSGYDSLLRVYRETDLSQEKTRILSSLPSCPDPNIIQEVLQFIPFLEVRSQDAVFGLDVSHEGRDTAWTWLKVKLFLPII
ncbi:hypothetical protein CRG98_007528 [Punica granatum]|uniref:Uncharacterized protein n=1 Tax=Punica granatum TaxID=22663 RepID=A0A2I0KUD6_PUNGR|nr:hypothetical protein CRG98_007528 [Punica granatum]